MLPFNYFAEAGAFSRDADGRYRVDLDKMRAAAPGAKFAVVPGVGHAPELNEPEAVAAIDGLLERIERGS